MWMGSRSAPVSWRLKGVDESEQVQPPSLSSAWPHRTRTRCASQAQRGSCHPSCRLPSSRSPCATSATALPTTRRRVLQPLQLVAVLAALHGWYWGLLRRAEPSGTSRMRGGGEEEEDGEEKEEKGAAFAAFASRAGTVEEEEEEKVVVVVVVVGAVRCERADPTATCMSSSLGTTQQPTHAFRHKDSARLLGHPHAS